MTESILQKLSDKTHFNFNKNIDLIDETLREGAERSPISPTVEDKYQMALKIVDIGIKSLVIGMFPDVPENIKLLKRLLQGQQNGDIAEDVRFIIISHVGVTYQDTLDALKEMGLPIKSVWILAVHSVSDMQIKHLYPKVIQKDKRSHFDLEEWKNLEITESRRRNIKWFDDFLPQVKSFEGGGIMIGLLDTFRSDIGHVKNVVDLVSKHGITQIRLVDTAGTCMPHQISEYVEQLVSLHPDINFYGHFHSDFGMGTANAIMALAAGAKGVDVSVGGFANRAGHPPVAEITTALYYLYGVQLKGFKYNRLCKLSRSVEDIYGLMESPTSAVTGVVTHGVLSGIRTQLIAEAPQIFDVLEAEFVGAKLKRVFGSRSGTDGMLRFIEANKDELEPLGMDIDQETANTLHKKMMDLWNAKSAVTYKKLTSLKNQYHTVLGESDITEDAMLEIIKDYAKSSDLVT